MMVGGKCGGSVVMTRAVEVVYVGEMCGGWFVGLCFVYGVFLGFFFFSSRRRHTRWPRDWSSDVCSSDLEKLRPLTRPTSPFVRGTPGGRGHHWVEPRLVCEVRFTEWTRDGGIRHPAFLGLREDKRPEECVRELPLEARGGEAEEAGAEGIAGPRGARALPGRGWAPSGRGGSDDGSRERVPSTPSAPASSVSPPRGHPPADAPPSPGAA